MLFHTNNLQNCISLLHFMTMSSLWVILSLVLAAASHYVVSATGGVFQVQHKFAGQQGYCLPALKDHDLRRHQRVLYSVDFPVGGDGRFNGTGLYYTKLKIGSPANDYYLQVDTGTDISVVNCIECKNCPKKSDLGVELTLYDPSTSKSSKIIDCDDDICSSYSNFTESCLSGHHCEYGMIHSDGVSTFDGYFVKDTIQYGRVTGDLQTTQSKSSVVFGCNTKVEGKYQEPYTAVDGILGFGNSESSILSQIAAASGPMEKMFAHCVDGKNGGGIFAMGNIVENVTTTPLLPNQGHLYFITLEGILIGNNSLSLPKVTVGTASGKEAMIDGSTTLAYFPEEIYTPLVNKILEDHSDLTVSTVGDTLQCFEYKSSLDTDFPAITLIFEGSVELVVYPHDYLVPYNGEYCIGWQNSATLLQDYAEIITLGDLVFANKLVIYDTENMNVGWKEYNCSSTVNVQDENSKAVYDVQAHRLSFTPKSASKQLDRSSPNTDGSSRTNHSYDRNQNLGRLTIFLLLLTIYHTLPYGAH